MPLRDVLLQIEVHQLADPAAAHDRVDLLVEGRVAEHVADLEQVARGLGRLDHADALRRRRRDRLLEQHVVAALEGGERRLDVEGVAGGDDRDVGEARPGETLGPVAKHVLGGDAVIGGDRVAHGVDRLGDGDDAQALRMSVRPARIHPATAIPGSDHDGSRYAHPLPLFPPPVYSAPVESKPPAVATQAPADASIEQPVSLESLQALARGLNIGRYTRHIFLCIHGDCARGRPSASRSSS